MEEETLARILRRERNFISCHEVSNYGCRADVLAVDYRKELSYEYEFKRSSQDLKISEFKKRKYKQERSWKYGHTKEGKFWSSYITQDYPRPNYFYFVVPVTLWEKEKEFLSECSSGIMTFDSDNNFLVQLRSKKNMSNVFKYERVYHNICIRLANVYVWKK